MATATDRTDPGDVGEPFYPGRTPKPEVIMKTTNTAEVYPVDFKILVHMDPFEETSKGGIVVAVGEGLEREKMARTRGTLISIGSRAFVDWPSKPRVGDRVLLAKYAGQNCDGYDGEEYRLCNDKDLAAVLGRERGDKADG